MTSAKIGRICGADAVITGSVRSVGETLQYNARVISVESAKVMFGESMSGERSRALDLESALCKSIALRLCETKMKFEEKRGLYLTLTLISGGFSLACAGAGVYFHFASEKANDEYRTSTEILITSPSAGQVLAGTVSVTVEFSGEAASVSFLVDGVKAYEAKADPFEWQWDTTAYQDGSHTLQAKLKDSAGNVSASRVIGVVIKNTQVDWGSISGNVTANQAPVADAVVATTVERTVRQTVTGADGRYTLDGLPAGVYNLMVTASGYDPQEIRDIVVGEGEDVTGKDIDLAGGQQCSCQGRQCGDDGCGTSCGECAEGKTCVGGTCQAGTACDPVEAPGCSDDGFSIRRCKPDGSDYETVLCNVPLVCQEGTCVCPADSCTQEGIECGQTSCGYECGTCPLAGGDPEKTFCSPVGKCTEDPAVIGCSDGTREGFLDMTTYPEIASCQATFQQQSLRTTRTRQACGNTIAVECTAPEDACALGWHICMRNGWPQDLRARVSGEDCGSPVAGNGTFCAASSSTDDCGTFPKPCIATIGGYTMSNPIACGSETIIHCCVDSVWLGMTRHKEGGDGCDDYPCGDIPSAACTGLLCCKDPPLTGE